MVARHLYLVLLKSSEVNFCFVEANYVRIRLFDVVLQILFAQDCTDPIYIPGGNEKFAWSHPTAILPEVCMILGASFAWV